MRKQGIALEHRIDLPLVGRHLVDALPVENHGAFILLKEAAQNPQQRGLSAAGRAQQRHKLILINVQVHAFQHDLPVKALDDISEFNQFAHGSLPLDQNDGGCRTMLYDF